MDQDGLLTQGDPQLPLTWMDAKVEDWVVTPRRGKPVEINALWYNASACWPTGGRRSTSPTASSSRSPTARRHSFNQRFWFESGGYLYDIVDGEAGDDAVVPAEPDPVVLAAPSGARRIALARRARCRDRRLLTPFGLRTLDPDHPDFKAQYFGDLRARDAAYHQGTVWAWLIGPFIDAWLRVHPGGREQARTFLERVRRPSERGLHRQHQRDLRRDRATRAARLRRAGVERRGSPSLSHSIACP